MRGSVVVITAVSLAFCVAACGHEAAGNGGVGPKSAMSSASMARGAGLDGTSVASKVFTARELLPLLLDSKSGHPGTTGEFGTGKSPQKGELEADCPAGAKDTVAELSRTSAPRAVQFSEPQAPGVAPASGPVEQLVAMSRAQAARYMSLKLALAVACPQTTVSRVGFTPIAPQTLRVRDVRVEVGDESFVEETTIWDGRSDSPSARPNAGERTYTIFIRMGGVIVIYGGFPTEAAALAGGAQAVACARPGLLRGAGG